MAAKGFERGLDAAAMCTRRDEGCVPKAAAPGRTTGESAIPALAGDGCRLRVAPTDPGHARLSSFVGALALGDLVKSTLGPKGMNKILHSTSTGEITVTNDGATILKSIALDNPAAKILVNISKVQDDEVGDGMFRSLCRGRVRLEAAYNLRYRPGLGDPPRSREARHDPAGTPSNVRPCHPSLLIRSPQQLTMHGCSTFQRHRGLPHRQQGGLGCFGGRRYGQRQGRRPLPRRPPRHRSHHTQFKGSRGGQGLLCGVGGQRSAAVEVPRGAFLSLTVDHIQIIKKQGGKLTDSYLDEGFILDKKIGVNCPHRMENAKILIANTPMDTDKIKIFGARVKVDSTGKLAELERAEREKMKAKVAKIKASGVNCFVNRQLIYNYPESLFAEAGIMSIEHADFEGVERLALVTGGEIASTFEDPQAVKLGKCDVIEEIMIGEDKLIKFSGVAAGEACTVVLRGATGQMIEEADRSLHDALSVLSQTVKETRVVLGGGCAEMTMAVAVDEEAKRTEGKKALAVESFAKALRQIPTILADNAGYDSSDLVAKLRAAHYEGRKDAGLDMERGIVGSMRECGVTESYKLKRQVILSASEAAEMILLLRSAPRRREGQ
ncbi:SPOSA6832_02189 [Sporobolomyces salmonicolor]|uniref:CCT-beta n=1 Tax=Sporidiobolus salmonicolor TaxID=5005 RepID=A0A0D6EKW7_SPOSA|nr:SPOSA6832_02189 [Sporobolomyces salmonicolor]